MKIGIPRSLFYYRFITFWEKFFAGLGTEIVVSDQTNKRILDDGVKACVDEACLPIKLFYGHVINLKDRVDYILVPRFTSISKKEYICPEFGGLPDMIRHTLRDLPPLIDTEVNMRNSSRGGLKAAIQTAALLGIDRRTAVRAYKLALGDSSQLSSMSGDSSQQFNKWNSAGATIYQGNGRDTFESSYSSSEAAGIMQKSQIVEKCPQTNGDSSQLSSKWSNAGATIYQGSDRDTLESSYSSSEAAGIIQKSQIVEKCPQTNGDSSQLLSKWGSAGATIYQGNNRDTLESSSSRRKGAGIMQNCQIVEKCPRIAVIGHPYNIYDRYISMDLLGKLARYGIEVRTIEMVGEAEMNAQAARLEKPMFWNHGRRAYGAALHLAEAGLVDGFICVTSFGCGIDSFVNDLIERSIRKKYNMPFITMTIDEHTGEAGFNTRLEAFVDMLRWRNSNEDHISAFG